MKRQLALVGAMALSLGASWAMGGLVLHTPVVSQDFEGYTQGQMLSQITPAWTGNAVDFVIAPGVSDGGSNVVRATNTSRKTANGPLFAAPAYATGDTVYFSYWMHTNTSASAGAEAGVTPGNGDAFVGFGITDSGTSVVGGGRRFIIRPNDAATPTYSTQTIANDTWYHIALVTKLEADITQSKGTLYVRNVTAGETEFTAVSDLSNINLNFTAGDSPLSFRQWRIMSSRYSAEVDNLASGYAVVPEPTALGLLTLGGLLALRRRR